MTMKKLLMISAIIIPLCCLGLIKPSASPAQKQKLILINFTNYILKHKESPWGVTAFSTLAQCKNNSPILVYGGTTDQKGNVPINKNSLFQIGSNTKSFIAVVILQLAQEYKLDIDSHAVISKYFPEYPKWGKITLRQLLNMTSGIYGNGCDNCHDIYKKFTAQEYRNYISPIHILNLEYKLPLSFKPGTKWDYSNTNYTLLGVLIQRITGHSPEYEVKKRIFDKLHLKHTYFPTNTLKIIPGVNQAEIIHGYSYWKKDYIPYSFDKFGQDNVNFSLSYANTAGAIASTPSDINTYLHALFTPGILLNARQLSEFTSLVARKDGQPFSPEKMPGDVGFGFGVFGFYSKQQKSIIYFYQGEVSGFEFFYFYDPKTQQFLTFGINTISTVITQYPRPIDKNNSVQLFYRLNAYCK